MQPQIKTISNGSDVMKKSLALAMPSDPRIVLLRRQKVIIDTDLAELYGVTVKRLNQQVTRNRERFPADLSFN